MQTKVIAAIAATAIVGVAFLVQRNDGAHATVQPTSALVAPTETSLVAAPGTVADSTPAPDSIERSAVREAEPHEVLDSSTVDATATLAVRVIDEVGVGLASVYVSLQHTQSELDAAQRKVTHGILPLKTIGGQTDESGWLTLQVPAERDLELRGSGTRTSRGVVLVPALEPGAHAESLMRVLTRPDIEVHGRVVEAVTGAPLGGVGVHVTQRRSVSKVSPLPPRDPPHTTTDENGEFRAPARSWLKTGALLTRPGFSPVLAWLRDADDEASGGTSAAPARPAAIEMLRAARIKGTLSGGRAGLIVRATATWRELSASASGRRAQPHGFGNDFELTAIVDSLGAFALEDVPAAAALTLTLTGEDRDAILLQASSPVKVEAGAIHRVAWALGMGGRIVCNVRENDGAPGVDEELWLVSATNARAGVSQPGWKPAQRARTDASGAAFFDDVQPGDWLVALAPLRQREPKPGDAVRYSVAATIEAPGAVVPVELTLYRDLWITGRVVTPDGTVVRSSVSAIVQGVTADWPEVGDTFRLGPLLPGPQLLIASPPRLDYDGPPLMASEMVTVEAGAEDVELRLRPGADVTLSAIDPDSGAALPADVQLVGKSHSSGGARGVDPSVTFAGLEPGTFAALVSTADGRAGLAILTLRVGERRDVSIPVSPTGSLRLRHTGPVGELSCRIEHAGVRVASHTVERGADKLVSLPAGTYDLHLSIVEDTPGGERTPVREEMRRVDLTAGVQLVVDLGR